jgi:hypothetical protein
VRSVVDYPEERPDVVLERINSILVTARQNEKEVFERRDESNAYITPRTSAPTKLRPHPTAGWCGVGW